MNNIQTLLTSSVQPGFGSHPLTLVQKIIQPILLTISSGPGNDQVSQKITRKKDAKQRELIEKYSQLTTKINPLIQQTLDSPLFKTKERRHLAAILGHLHGNRIIGNSPLENLPLHIGTQLIEAYLENCPLVALDPKGFAELKVGMAQFAQVARELSELEKNASAINSYSKKLTEHVFQLKEGASFFIGGGACENKLHSSIAYEFKKNQDQSYDLFVYVISKENSHSGDLLSHGNRLLIRPYIHFKSIPAEEIFFMGSKVMTPQSDLFQGIVETQFANAPVKFASLTLFAHFEPYFLPSSQECRGFLTAAHSHTDGWQEERGIIFRYLGRENYKKLVIDLKMSTLIEGYQLGAYLILEDTVEGAEIREVLKTGAQQMLKSLVSYKRNGWLSFDQPTQFKATCLDLLARLNEAEKKIAQERIERKAHLTFKQPTVQKERITALELAKKSIVTIKEDKKSVLSSCARLRKLWKPRDFSSQLKNFAMHFSPNSEVKIAEIEHLVAQFPIPKSPSAQSNYWALIPEQDLYEAIQGLELLTKHYDLATREGEIRITPRQANTVYALYVSLHYLAVRLDTIKSSKKSQAPALLASYPLFFPGELYDHDDFLIYTAPEDFQRRREIYNYCQNSGAQKEYDPLFDFRHYWYCNQKGGEREGNFFNFFARFAQAHRLKQLIDPKGALDTAEKVIPHLSPEKENNALKAAGLGYLPALAYAAFLAYQFSGYTHLRAHPKGSFELKIEESYFRRYNQPLDGLGVKLYAGDKEFKDYKDANEGHELYPSSSPMHPQLLSDYRLFPRGDFATRNRKYPTLTDEAKILASKSQKDNLERSSLEPYLHPHRMLYDYKERLDLFTDPEEQTLFEIEFFRTFVSSKKGFIEKNYSRTYFSTPEEWFPLSEEMHQIGFIKECKEFIRAGVEHYYDLQLGGRPHVMATLFFLRLSLRLSRFSNEPLFHPLPYLQRMLARNDLSDEERSALCLHLILAYSLQKAPLTDSEKKDVFQAWVYYKNVPLAPRWKSTLLEREVNTFIHTLTPSDHSAMHSEKHQRDLLNDALRLLGMGPLPDTYKMENSAFPNIRASTEKGAFWEINLVTGKVCSESGLLIKGAIPNWIPKEALAAKNEEHVFYKTFFQGREHSYFQAGGAFYFQDPYLGQMRVVNGKILTGLQRKMGEEWYQYVKRETLMQGSVPYALLADHTHWIPLNPPASIVICDFATGEVRALLTDQGEIYPVGDSTRVLYAPIEEGVLSQMDAKEYILCTEHQNRLIRIAYPRFCSQIGEVLFFDVQEGVVIYGLNRKFRLAEEQQCGLLGGIPEYLFLQDDEGKKQKVLVPRRLLSSYQPLSAHHRIATHVQLDDTKYGLELPQRKSAVFLEYDVKNNQLIPLTTEGSLHLAYLYLTQREYVKAKELIESVNYKTALSPLSGQILEGMIQVFETGMDCSPEAAAITLWAYNLARRAWKRDSKSPLCSTPYQAFKTYMRYQESIPASLEYHGKKVLQKVKESQVADVRAIMKGFVAPLKILPLQYPRAGFSKEYHNGWEAYSNYRQAENATKFLHESSKSTYHNENIFLVTLYGKNYSVEGFFRTAYQIALRGSEEEKRQLAFRLQLMEALRSDAPQSELAAQERNNGWSILQFALLHPDLVPQELPPMGEVLEAYAFLNKMNDLILTTRDPTSEKRKESPLQEPLPLAIQLKTVFPEKKQVNHHPEPLVLSLIDKKGVDDGFLEEIFPLHFDAMPSKAHTLNKITLPYDPKLAETEDEKAAERAIDKLLKEFEKGFEEGGKINEERVAYASKDFADLKVKLQKKEEEIAIDLHNLEVAILEIANKKEPQQKEEFQLLREAKVEAEFSIKKLIWLFLGEDKTAFRKAMPYLTTQEFEDKIAKYLGMLPHSGIAIEYLYELIGTYLTLSVYKQRLDRAATNVDKILTDVKLSNLEKEVLVQKIAYELNPQNLNTYIIADNPSFLVFEYFSGLPIRSDQVHNLFKLLETDPKGKKYRNQLIQMIMGGGKTSVLAVILLKLAARRGLALFCTASAQYSSVAHNLRRALKESFDQDMEEIDIPADQIYQRCGTIIKRLKKTANRGDFLPVKAETLLCLQLKFITAVFDAIGTNTRQLSEINTLRSILELLRASGELLIDEVDLVLHILREMNFPRGEKQRVAPERIELIRELFALFVSEKAPINEEKFVNLKELIKLQENRQTLLSEKDFKESVAIAVAWKFVKEDKRLLLGESSDFHLSFYRYISGQMNTDCQKVLEGKEWQDEPSEQDKKDLLFLQYVHDLRFSKVGEKEEAAHQIALVKHMMRTVFPMTFQKMGNRHYGRGLDHPGEVRPYLAVDTPSHNYFGYIYEWIAYHFQTVLQRGVDLEQLNALAAIYKEGACASLRSKKLVMDEKSDEILSPEALEFRELTGVDLEMIERPGKLKEAVEYVNQHVDSQLRLEAETASDQVFYHPCRVTANGFSLVNMCNARGMSATLNNAHCFEDCLADDFEPDIGTVGQIANLIVNRIHDEKKEHIHFVNSRDLEEILTTTLDAHPQKAQVRMPLDAGALFKNCTNLEVAKALKKKMGMPVLFFMRDPKKDEKHPDTLALLPLDSDQPQIIGGTRLEDIETKGLTLHDYIAYLGERHTTGTDLPMPFDTIGLMTCDETILDRTLWQTIFRLRQIFLQQRIEFIIPKDILSLLLNKLKIVPKIKALLAYEEQLKKMLESDLQGLKQEVGELLIFFGLLIRAILNQAIAKCKEYVRSRKQKIDSFFEQTLLVKHLLIGRDLTQNDLDQLAPFKKVLELPQTDAPYDQVGALEIMVDAIEDLRAYGKCRLKQFKEAYQQEQMIKQIDVSDHKQTAKEIEEKIRQVIAKAEKSPWMLKMTPSPGVNELGMEVDILNEVTQEVNQEVTQEIDQELLKELELYDTQCSAYHQYRVEDLWNDPQIEAFLTTLSNLSHACLGLPQECKTLFQLLKSFGMPSTQHTYHSLYAEIFDTRILVSKNWAYTTEQRLHIFHRLQRPAEAILLIKGAESYYTVLISQHEATQFKEYFNRLYKEGKWQNIWLILPDGAPLEDNPFAPPPIYEAEELLFQINVFKGNINYLEEHPDKTTAWFNQIDDEAEEWLKEATKLSLQYKIKFLRMRVERDPVKKKRLAQSPLFGGKKSEKQQIYASYLREKIDKLTKEEIQQLGSADKKILWSLSDQQLLWLLPSQFELLHPMQQAKLQEKMLGPQISKPKIIQEQMSEKHDPPTQNTQPIKQEKIVPPQNAIPKPIVSDPTVQQFAQMSEKLDPPTLNTQPIEKEKKEPPQNAVPKPIVPDPTVQQFALNTAHVDEKIESPKSTREDPQAARCITITRIALFAIGLLCLAASIVGVFATIGSHASWAPDFMVTVAKGLKWQYIAYILLATGPTYGVALALYFLVERKRRQRQEIRI